MGNSLAENLGMRDERNLLQATGYNLGAVSGLVTAVAAGGDLFALRNVSSRPVVLSSLRIVWSPVTAFGAAQAVAFRANKVYGFTAIHDTAGTAVQVHYKRQSQIRGSSVGDRVPLTDLSAYIAGTAAITGATYTAPDADEPDCFASGAGGLLPFVGALFTPQDGLPTVLEQNQGIVIKNHTLMGASGVGHLWVGLELFRESGQ